MLCPEEDPFIDGDDRAGGAPGPRAGAPAREKSPPDVVVLDNRDSFTFNIAQELERLGASVRVVRALDATAAEVLAIGAPGLLIGPGPGAPETAGCTEALVRRCVELGPAGPRVFGLCLGLQALATALGGRLRRASTLVHGATRPVTHDGAGLFAGVPNPVALTRYNSLAVDEQTLPPGLEVTARTEDGDVAGLRLAGAEGRIEGVQCHPESILCLAAGRTLFTNFLAIRCRTPGCS